MKFLIDTNVVSETSKAQCHPAVRAWLAKVNDDDLHISVITLGELASGIVRLLAGARRDSLQDWLAETELFFVDRVLPIDREIARLWGNLAGQAAMAGRTMPLADALIAATALHHDLHVVTRNVNDFASLGVQLINPWTATNA